MNNIIHTIPVNDIRPHIQHEKCACSPRKHVYKDGIINFIHSGFDGRDHIEKFNEEFPESRDLYPTHSQAVYLGEFLLKTSCILEIESGPFKVKAPIDIAEFIMKDKASAQKYRMRIQLEEWNPNIEEIAWHEQRKFLLEEEQRKREEQRRKELGL